MSTKTTNYNLIKPNMMDSADISVLNANFDTIDTTMKTLENKTAPYVVTSVVRLNSVHT